VCPLSLALAMLADLCILGPAPPYSRPVYSKNAPDPFGVVPEEMFAFVQALHNKLPSSGFSLRLEPLLLLPLLPGVGPVADHLLIDSLLLLDVKNDLCPDHAAPPHIQV
jgi:hypothetical protein